MRFEFDPSKNASNLVKHGVSLEDVQILWSKAGKEFFSRTQNEEARYIRMGFMKGALHVAVFTYKGTTIRLISARPATRNEIEIYAKTQ
jgi:uncharacterized DUF497 family protein